MNKWSVAVSSPVPSSPTDPVSRRDALALVGAGSLSAVAGCSSLPWSSQGYSPPERRVPADWRPDPGEWPMRDYGYARTAHSPFASPPRDDPDTAWSYEPDGSGVYSLIVAADSVFVRTDAQLVALTTDGDLRWEESRSETGQLQFVAGRLYDVGTDSVTALRPDGTEEWSTALDTGRHHVLERDGWVFLLSGDGIVRLHADTGAVVDETTTRASGPTTTGGPVYTGWHSMAAYDVHDGEFQQRWAASPDEPYERYGLPAVANGRLYRPEQAVSGTDGRTGRLSVYDTADGSRLGGVPLEHTPRRPATDGERVYVSTSTVTASTLGQDGRLVALSLDADLEWDFSPDASLQRPVVADGTVYVAPYHNDDAPLVAFEASTGDELWRRDVDAVSELAVAGKTLYVAGDAVHAFSA